MRWRPFTWLLLSAAFFVAAVFFWLKGDEWAANKNSHFVPASSRGQTPSTPAVRPVSSTSKLASVPVQLLSQAGTLNAPPNPAPVRTNKTSLTRYQVRNTSRPVEELVRDPKAVLLENAMIDTALPVNLAIPPHLQAAGDPGSYIVQGREPFEPREFRARLAEAGATIVSYIPNNAYLVRASATVAGQLSADSLTASVLAYEPYYKIKGGLLQAAVDQQPLPEGSALNVLLFADASESAIASLQALGGQILGRDQSPFGPVVKLRPPMNSLAAVAGLAGVQVVEWSRTRIPANDLSRAIVGVAADSVTTTNYFGLTGTNILVSVNDTGVDTNHPDLQGRVYLDPNAASGSGIDTNGHGTHVAGIIAGNGAQSLTVTNAEGSIMPATNGQFRGKAPGAKLFSQRFTDLDFSMQQKAAQTNAFLSNNSWNNSADYTYDLAAASYDAAVRDALPFLSRSQPMVYVFSAGNAGDLNVPDSGAFDNGIGGDSDTILSPATAKNVITVGAVEMQRNITNQTWLCTITDGTNSCNTNTPWLSSTDSGNQVAGFSSRGNVGIQIEGKYGRFKPDVVAPGTFVVSTRSTVWDEHNYYNGTNYSSQSVPNYPLASNATFTSAVFVPGNAVQLIVAANNPQPTSNLAIFVTSPSGAVTVGTNFVALPPAGALTPLDDFWIYTISNGNPQTVASDIFAEVLTINDHGNYFDVLSNLNNSISGNAPYYYRYESGTSMAAADVTGTLALMEEFFEQRLKITNSPAMMKALLINGARSVGDLYNFQVNNSINYQGWGMISLPTTLPSSLSNLTSSASGSSNSSSMFLFDQSPTNALSTGASATRTFTVNTNSGAKNQPLRFTLVWTDPPGNPSAGVKLVNDLDLIVTNLDNQKVYFGNDIAAGNDYNLAWNTNTAPNNDVVNNVENIYINQPLGARYSVTVAGRHVNVNAVTANTNDVVQDYALVVSCGDGQITNALSLTATTSAFVTAPLVSTVTNQFPPNPDFPITGGLLLNQHVGANTPLLGTNTVLDPQFGNAVITLGMTNQWHFYVLSNDLDFTNASFVTFLPVDLSVPRMGVTNISNPDNATRAQADIDLYVSTSSGLTNLDPLAISNAFKSLGRGGEEFVVLSNAAPHGVYYVGVKSEDQMGAEYAFLGVFSRLPLNQTGNQGENVIHGVPVPQVIPPGTPPNPQAATVLLLSLRDDRIRRVVLTNTWLHQFPGNLLGNLSHGKKFSVLNNHSCVTDRQGDCFTNFSYIYEDNGEGNVPGSRHTDGPGSLRDFIGEQGLGVWMLTEVNNFPSGTGMVESVTMKLEPEFLGPGSGQLRAILPNTWTYDSIDVPADATNLTVCVSGNTQPVQLYVRLGDLPNASQFDQYLLVNPPGDCLSITPFDTPPLQAGRYYIGVFNPPANVTQNVRITATIDRNEASVANTLTSTGGSVTIQEDAVTYAYLTNLSDLTISGLDVGVLISDPRVSDLALTLIAPDGTRVLLFQNRGWLTTNGLGSVALGTNGLGVQIFGTTNMSAFYTNNFDSVPVGQYRPTAVFDGWNVLSNWVQVVPDLSIPWLSNNILVLADGIVSNSLPTTNSTYYSLSYRVTHAPWIVGMVGWWPFDQDPGHIALATAPDIFGGHDALLFGDVQSILGKVNLAYAGDGVATRAVVPACPELNVGLERGFTIEGWINPVNVTNLAPLVEWTDRPTNAAPAFAFPLPGVSFLLGLTNGPGSLGGVIWDTNSQPHLIGTAPNSVTNGGWQHVALSYDTNTLLAKIYVNGQLSAAQVVSAASFVPRTTGDLYFGFHPAVRVPETISYQGGLDEFALYKRALTDCEIAAIYTAGGRGKYGTNALTCPVTNSLDVVTATGTTTYTFVNGTNGMNVLNGQSWYTNGPIWETNIVYFSNPIISPTTNAPGTNLVGIVLRSGDPNVAVDDFILSRVITNLTDGFVHFTEDTNQSFLPIKFAPAPYAATNFPPVLVFSNDFENAYPRVYQTNETITGGTHDPAQGPRDWRVVQGPVTVVTNAMLDATGSNLLALATGVVECDLPTLPGHRYQLTYTVRGPAAVGWWNGDIDPLNQRARDLIGGNDGAFIYPGATNSPAGFVTTGRNANALYLAGMLDHSNNIATKIELGDPDNLAFTNSFTIEGWVMPQAQTNSYILSLTGEQDIEQIFFRGDARHNLDPYWFALEQDPAAGQFALLFHIEGEDNRDGGVTLETGSGILRVDGNYHHVAAVFEANVLWTNNPPWPTNQLRLYFDGVLQTNVYFETDSGTNEFPQYTGGFTSRSPFRNLDPNFSPGVSIGNVSRTDTYQPYRGWIDELSVYGRALTDPEIAAIFNAGSAGKFDPGVVPSLSLAKVNVSIDGELRDTARGDNTTWTTRTITFSASQTNAVLNLQGLLPGTLVDDITLTEIPPELSYLPEESLAALIGHSGRGVWALEIQDTRSGDTNTAQLVSWQLNFTLVPSNPPPVVYLSHGIPYTNTLPAHGVQNLVVPFPQWATNATNILLSANQFRTLNPLPVGVFCDLTNHFPVNPANALFWPPAVATLTNVLSTNALVAPINTLTPGQPYYLTVTNPNAVAVTYSFGVWYDIVGLTNCVLSTNFVGPAGIPRYFQFDVPTNADWSQPLPQSVTFWLSGAQSNLTVVASQHLPLPDLGHHDYISQWPCTNDEIIMVLTNTTPFPIQVVTNSVNPYVQTNRWYVGVYNSTATNVPFSVQACWSTNYPVIIPLTNAIAYDSGTNNPAPPGPPRQTFFEFTITNYVNGVLFELYNLAGDADLLLQREVPPTMAPYFDGSFELGRAPEQIVVRPSYELPDLRGHWFLGIYNNEVTNVAYSIRAITPDTNGMLISALPITPTIAPLNSPRGDLISWNAIVGESYVVQHSATIPFVWTNLAGVVATTPLATYEQIPALGGYYRIQQVPQLPVFMPVLSIQLWTNNLVRISWSTAFPGYTLQYSQGLPFFWIDSTLPVTVEGNQFVVYDVRGPTPRYYRLIK
jgi:subtilisin family serine protease/subtilisin-like proprotein convertase family protein